MSNSDVITDDIDLTALCGFAVRCNLASLIDGIGYEFNDAAVADHTAGRDTASIFNDTGHELIGRSCGNDD